jgi:cysteine synthase A
MTAVALAPDLGERYLDTVYQTNWVQELYGQDVLDNIDETPAAQRAVSRRNAAALRRRAG